MNSTVQVQPQPTVDPQRAQRMAALELGNQKRFAIAAARRHLRTAATRAVAWERLADMIDEGLTEELHGLTLADLLRSCRYTGPSAVITVLALVGVTERRHANNLNGTERDLLLTVLRAGDVKSGRRLTIGGAR
jgi:hypothetical protein